MRITTIGIDLAKAVFQMHGADEQGNAFTANFADACRINFQ